MRWHYLRHKIKQSSQSWGCCQSTRIRQPKQLQRGRICEISWELCLTITLRVFMNILQKKIHRTKHQTIIQIIIGSSNNKNHHHHLLFIHNSGEIFDLLIGVKENSGNHQKYQDSLSEINKFKSNSAAFEMFCLKQL